jgi:hypothetical protein
VRVLFLHSGTEDYLSQGLFHGLRAILGPDCVDVPRFDVMYRDLPADRRAALRGRGFTLYCLLDDLPGLEAIRAGWADRIASFDLVVLANVWRQWWMLFDPRIRAAWGKLVIVDGEDGPAFFPYSLRLCLTPRAFASGITSRPYFKREWVGGGADFGKFARHLPGRIRRALRSPRRARPIGFAIPAEKFANFDHLEKTKDFTRHLVDPELAAATDGFFSAVGSDKYMFLTEFDYYTDLQASRFGVTTKRSGWDCLRHYELAANGCVLCFRDLDQKPHTCAPHGLTAANCVTYHSRDELIARLRGMSGAEYQELLAGTREWVAVNTTAARARAFLVAATN